MSLGKILVVDDEKNLLELIAMGLEHAGYDVVAAMEAGEAITRVKEETIDLPCLISSS